MKKIKIPTPTTFSFDLSGKSGKITLLEVAGPRVISYGSVSNEEVNPLLDIAKDNGGQVLYATTSISKQIEDIITDYLMGDDVRPSKQKNFLQMEIVESSNLTFSFKKELLFKIIQQEKLLKKKEKDLMQRCLADVMNKRNSFAHGKLSVKVPNQIILSYYRNGKKSEVLNDEYWDKTKTLFFKTAVKLEQIHNSINSRK